MSESVALVIVFLVSYLLGSINFSKILTSLFFHKNIEKEGSGNPGTMNVLRSHGAVVAILTLLLEVVKAGLTAWLCRFLCQGYGHGELVFFFSGLTLVIGSCFPFFGLVRGGKGIATMGGVFLFSNLWYVGLALFFVGVVQICITEYGFISSMIFLYGMCIAQTVYVFVLNIPFAWLICVLVWIMCALITLRHYKNFYRLFTHQENKAGFKDAFKRLFKKKKQEPEQSDKTNSQNLS